MPFNFNEYAKEGYYMKNIYVNCMEKDQLICPDSHELEMTFKLLLDKEFKLILDTMNVLHRSTDMTEWQETIPKNTMYCGSCKFKAYSN